MSHRLRVVLFEPQYPENIGMAARACANMGVSDLVVVNPENFDMDKAVPLATGTSEKVLRAATVVDTLEQALEDMVAAYGATARTGGWRRGMMSPSTCARIAGEKMRSGGRVALVFGPEKAGLTNEQTKVCSGLVTIPTSRDCSSLNLAQAVLILTYECFKDSLGSSDSATESAAGSAAELASVSQGDLAPEDRQVTIREREVLHSALRDALTSIDYIKDENAEYWMLPVRRFVERMTLKRAEFNLLMGVCRQIRWVAGKAGLISDGRMKEHSSGRSDDRR